MTSKLDLMSFKLTIEQIVNSDLRREIGKLNTRIKHLTVDRQQAILLRRENRRLRTKLRHSGVSA